MWLDDRQPGIMVVRDARRKADAVAALVPIIDLAAWFDGDRGVPRGRRRQVDQARAHVWVLLITGQPRPCGPCGRGPRSVAREFFALPAEVKARYAIAVRRPRLDPARGRGQRVRRGHAHATGT